MTAKPRKPRKARASVLTCQEWYDMRRRGEAPAHMMPRKMSRKDWANLPDNVVRITPGLRHALKCLNILRAHTAVLMNNGPPEAA